MDWKERALVLLKNSLEPVPSELNEIDWKSGLSDKTDRLAQHISAFANHLYGGILVYGVNDDGSLFSLGKEQIDDIVKKLGNIAHNNLSHRIQIEHAVEPYNGENLLFIFIPEEQEKPVHLRGKDIYDSYYRSGGQTLKMSSKQVQMLIAKSMGISFEKAPPLTILPGRRCFRSSTIRPSIALSTRMCQSLPTLFLPNLPIWVTATRRTGNGLLPISAPFSLRVSFRISRR